MALLNQIIHLVQLILKQNSRRSGRPSPVQSPGTVERGTSHHSSRLEATEVGVWDTERRGLPPLEYAPHRDGIADPGEVVWMWVPYEEDPSRGKDRPVLVLSRHHDTLVVSQLTSKDHDRDAAQEAHWGRYWFDIGTGSWDRKRRPSEMRVDRFLTVPIDAVRREGGRISPEVFEQVRTHLEVFYR